MRIEDVPTEELEADRDRRCFSIYSPMGRFFEGRRGNDYIVMNEETAHEFMECMYWLNKIDAELFKRKRQSE